MASNTEKQLHQLISSQARIEAMLTKLTGAKSANDKDKGKTSTDTTSVNISKNFAKIAKNLESIESESKKTNKLLTQLIQISTFKSKETAKEIGDGARAMGAMGKGIDKLMKAVQVVSKVPDKAIDKFKSIIMVSAFLDPKTGKPLASEAQLEKAGKATKSIMNIVKGIALFGLTMVAFSMLVPQIAKGALGFAIVVAGLVSTIFLLDKALGRGAGGLKDTSALGSLHKLGMSIALFGVTMILFGLVTPQIAKGALGFTIVLAGLTLALFLMDLVLGRGAGGLKDTSPLGSLHKLGIAIALFGVTMVLFSFVIPQIAIGSLAFIIVLGALTLSLVVMDKILGKGDGGLKDTSPLGSLARLLKGIVLFAVGMVLLSLVVVPFAVGTLAMILALTALAGAVALWGLKPVERGARALKKALIPILGVAAAALLFKLVGWEDIGKMAATVAGTGIAFAIVGLVSNFVEKGATALQKAAVALIMVSVGVLIFSFAAKDLTWTKIAMLGAVIGGLALIGTIAGIGPIPGFLMAGSAALIVASVALIAISIGLVIYAQAAKNLTWKKIGMLGAVIGGLALIGTLAGIPPIPLFIIMGAGALIVAAAALVIIATGLLIFSKANWDSKKSKNLNGALTALIAGFLGYEDINDIGVGALAWVPMMSGLLILSSIALILASVALLPISMSLAIFKKTKWTDSDSKNLKSTILAITEALTNDKIEWTKVWSAVWSLKDVGKALTGLAEGVQAFANLTFTEYEYDKTHGKLVPMRKVKLTENDIKSAGRSIGYVLSAITKPLAEFGEQMTTGKGSGFMGVDWGKMISIQFGINSLRGIGTGLVHLATGVQEWANMTVTEWGIQQDKTTGLNVLVPMAKRKITEGEIKAATKNIATVLGAMVVPIRDFGDMIDGSAAGGNVWQQLGWQKSGVEKGMASFKTLGEGLVNLSQGVMRWANMQTIEYTIQKDKETGLNRIVPGKITRMTEGDLKAATANITHVIGALIEPLQKWGDFIDGNTKFGLFSSYNSIDKGIVSLAMVGAMLSRLAKGVAGFASMQFTVWEVVKDKKTGKNTLQPKEVVHMGKKEINDAMKNLKTIISIAADAIFDFSDKIEKKGGWFKVEGAISTLKNVYMALSAAAKLVRKEFSKLDEKSVNNFKKFSDLLREGMQLPNFGKYNSSLSALSMNFFKLDLMFNKKFGLLGLKSFSLFTKAITVLSKASKPFERFVSAFERLATSMGTFANNFKIMSPEGIQAFSVWTNSLVKAVEVGKAAEKGTYDKFLQASEGSLETAFQFGKKQLGIGETPTTPGEKQSIIDETLKKQEKNDPQTAALLKAIQALQAEVSQLKTALGGTLDVNISGVDGTAVFKTQPK